MKAYCISDKKAALLFDASLLRSGVGGQGMDGFGKKLFFGIE